jgi:hypothetical protein
MHLNTSMINSRAFLTTLLNNCKVLSVGGKNLIIYPTKVTSVFTRHFQDFMFQGCKIGYFPIIGNNGTFLFGRKRTAILLQYYPT